MIGYCTIFDSNYPKLLKEIADPPIVLYIKGNLEAVTSLGISIVGSRKFTYYGQKVAYRFSKECAEAGATIFSGLALGIDAIAHKGAIDAEGTTVGVLGCGLDKIYPVSNSELGREILSKNGAIISEFAPGTPPLKQNFPLRNRIIAGLSNGTLVIEAAEKSGALITAYQALEYNRDVYAVPGNIDSPFSIGANLLIQKGAKLVLKPEDILDEINLNKKISQTNAQKTLPETSNEKIILDILSRGEKLIDELIRETSLNIVEITAAITTMEMKGLIQNLGGGRVQKA